MLRKDEVRPLGPPQVLFLSLVATIGLGFLDYVTGLEVRIFPLYFVPVGLAAWRGTRRSSLGVAAAAISAWEVASRAGGQRYEWAVTEYWNVAIQFCSLLAFALLLARLRELVELERTTSRTDALTQVHNSRGFLDLLTGEMDRARRYRHPLTLVYLDLDNFKLVNDQHGHAAGDAVLVRFAQLLRAGLRKSDCVARLGGDEFAVLLVETRSEQARPLLERIRTRVRDEMKAQGLPVTASVGAVELGDPKETADDFMRRADALMYESKRGGKDAMLVTSSPGRDASGQVATELPS